MDRPNLSVVHTAAATAVEVGRPKEPPQRSSVVANDFKSVSRSRAFDYNWKERLDAVNPYSHPKMPFTQYREYEDRLHAAVRIINATVRVDQASTIEYVREAFDRLREARRNGNLYLRETNRGLTDYQIKGEDLESLLKLAMVAGHGSSLQKALGHQWLREQKQRDNPLDDWQLRKDLERGLDATMPNSYAEELHQRAIFHFRQKDARAADLATRMAAANMELR